MLLFPLSEVRGDEIRIYYLVLLSHEIESPLALFAETLQVTLIYR
jgi:hypothetical protein